MAKRQKIEAKEEAIDRISSLPDFILADILSHLPLHSAVSTSVLSRRWRYLWTHLTHLNFDASGLRRYLGWESYIATFNRLLPQFTSPKIHSLRLNTPYGSSLNDNNVQATICSWFALVCDRLLERIEVNVRGWVPYGFSIPAQSCMFQSQSLEILSLNGRFKLDVNLVVNLPKLKELVFRPHVLDPLLLAKLLNFCPLLERLSLQCDFWEGDHPLDFDLSPFCLKTLYINVHQNVPQQKLIINASKLEDITLRGFYLPNLSFIKPFGALYTADVNLKSGSIDVVDYHSYALEFAELMSSASTLCLNFTAVKAFSKLKDNSLPIFDNLSDLKIEFDDMGGSWNDLLLFLKYSPNLQNLILNLHLNSKLALVWSVPRSTLSCGLSNLKSIHIKRLQGRTADYMMMKYILSNAKVLELLSIHISVPSRRKDTTLWKEYEFCEKLFLLESSSACEIKCFGQFLTISSTGGQNKRPHCQSIRLGELVV